MEPRLALVEVIAHLIRDFDERLDAIDPHRPFAFRPPRGPEHEISLAARHIQQARHTLRIQRGNLPPPPVQPHARHQPLAPHAIRVIPRISFQRLVELFLPLPRRRVPAQHYAAHPCPCHVSDVAGQCCQVVAVVAVNRVAAEIVIHSCDHQIVVLGRRVGGGELPAGRIRKRHQARGKDLGRDGVEARRGDLAIGMCVPFA